MVNFKILLRYRGSQQRANTTTKQKTVLATSSLCKQNKISSLWNIYGNIWHVKWSRLVNNLLGVVTQHILSLPQHLPGHERVEDRGPNQWHAEVKAKEPPVFHWFIKLLMEHDRSPQTVSDAEPEMINGCQVKARGGGGENPTQFCSIKTPTTTCWYLHHALPFQML